MVSLIRGWFRLCLNRHPVLTNTAVYAVFYAAAELSQQTFYKYYTSQKPDYDLVAVAKIATVGSVIYAPILYFWYALLDTRLQGKSFKIVITKVAADQLIMSPTLLILFYTGMAIAEQKDDIFEELRDKFIVSFCADQMFWIPGQTMNFYFVPSRFRVMYVACASYFWINILCYLKRQKIKEERRKKYKLFYFVINILCLSRIMMNDLYVITSRMTASIVQRE